MDYRLKFESGHRYDEFLAAHGTDENCRRFAQVYDAVALTDQQQALLASLVRPLNLLCLAGAWCGDCVEQCPILQRLCEASSCLELRMVDRDADSELAANLMLCGSPRVPQVVFLSEDFEFAGRYGDRTLPKYRRLAQTQLGAACPTGLMVDLGMIESVTQEWLDEIERVHWMLRLSPKLRQRHGD